MSSDEVAQQPGGATALDPGMPKKGVSGLTFLGGIAALAAIYFVTARLSLLLAIPPGYATAVWPASGAALAALLLYGSRLWPGILIGSLLANMTTALGDGGDGSLTNALLISAGIGIGASLQALLAASLVAPILRRDPGLLETKSIVGVLGLGGPLACLVSATWGTSTLFFTGAADPAHFPVQWFTWWTGDVIGVLLVLPLAYIGLGEPRVFWRRRFYSVAVPLSLTLIAVTFGFFASDLHERRRLQLDFEREAVTVGDGLARRLAVYLEVVHSLQSFYAASSMVTRDEFKQYVNRALRRVPGIQALSWNPRIPHSERESYEAAARQDGLEGFTIRELSAGRMVAAGVRTEYVFVNFIEPQEGNENAVGYDVYSNPDRRAALDKARDSGRAVATSAITLVQETGSQSGVLVFVPVYEGGAIPERIDERRSRLQGYVVGVFRIGDVLRTALEGVHVRSLDVRLFDDQPGSAPGLLAAYRVDASGYPELLTDDVTELGNDTLKWSNNYPMAERTWRLVITPAPDFFSLLAAWQAWALLAGGLCLTALLGIFLLTLTGRRILDEEWAIQLAGANLKLRGEIQQREQTEHELQTEKDRAQVTLHSIGDAVITTDSQGVIEYMNPVAENLTGWNLEEAKGKPITSVFQAVIEATREPAEDPVKLCLTQQRIVTFVDQMVLISRSGREYAIQDSAAPIRDRDGKILGVVLVFNDMTESRRMVREVAHQASHDPLTGLCNRREFDKRLERALEGSKKYGSKHALCYLDLDQFKIVNDTAGHRAGDELLKRLAGLLEEQVRDRDTVARLGGDEFGVLLDNCPVEKAVQIAEKLVTAVRRLDFSWDERSYEIGASIGVVSISGEVQSGEELLTHADVACYAAKDLGRNRVHLYQADLNGSDPRHREILRAADIQRSVENNKFVLHYQPIFELGERSPLRPWRYELLVRMLDLDDQLVHPTGFIPAAERYGLMNRIDRWVVETAFRDFSCLFPGEPEAQISINLSGNSINDPEFLKFLQTQFKKYQHVAGRVCFEITETAAIRNLDAARQLMSQIKEFGGEFALDDFGSGLSSFAYLKGLPVDYLKIDGSFVRNIEQDLSDRAMVEAIHSVAETLKLRTVAEYVESKPCVNVLTEIGIDYGQGFALGRPRPLPAK